jgi:hypothetical protein
VCEEVATCYQLVATRRPKAVLDVEFDEHFESEVRVTLASMVREIWNVLQPNFMIDWLNISLQKLELFEPLSPNLIVLGCNSSINTISGFNINVFMLLLTVNISI